MSNIQQLFSIPVYKKNLQGIDVSSFRSRVLELLDIDSYGDHISVAGMKDASTINTYGIECHMQNWEETNQLVNAINPCIAEYWKELNYHPNIKPYIQEMWATISRKAGYVPSHFHGPTPITAVYYLDKTEGSGDLIIQHPLEALLGSQPINFPFDEFEQRMKIQQGDLIMFPGYIRHKTERNVSDDIRISIGMNIASRGEYVASQWNQV